MIDLCRDIWSYVSRGILKQKRIPGEVGSSTMPHKINPIQFENAEGNLGLANSILGHLSNKLPISRMQRDLTDSTTLRNQGIAMGYSYLACKNILKGLKRITVNKPGMKKELNSHWEVLAEAVQTVLRKSGSDNAYEQLKNMTQGETVTSESIIDFVKLLRIPEEDKKRLKFIRSHIGEHAKLMLDANQIWGVDEAIDRMKELTEFNPIWIEEPTARDDVEGHLKIKNALKKYDIGVATGEQVPSPVIFKQLLTTGAIDFCQIDATRLGGVNDVLAVFLMAKKYNIPVLSLIHI